MLYVQKSCCLFFWSMSVPFTLLHFFALQYLYYCGSQSQAKCFVRHCISVLQEIVPVFLEPVSALQIGAGCHCLLMAPSAIPRGLLPPPGIAALRPPSPCRVMCLPLQSLGGVSASQGCEGVLWRCMLLKAVMEKIIKGISSLGKWSFPRCQVLVRVSAYLPHVFCRREGK